MNLKFKLLTVQMQLAGKIPIQIQIPGSIPIGGKIKNLNSTLML